MSEGLSTEEHARWWKEAGGWQLCQLLYWKWDPIGVNDSFPWTYDEYDAYAGSLLELLRNGADAAKVAQHLREVAWNQMGMSRPASEVDATAQQIVDWYPSSIDWWRERSL
jgi:hypothetical protein